MDWTELTCADFCKRIMEQRKNTPWRKLKISGIKEFLRAMGTNFV